MEVYFYRGVVQEFGVNIGRLTLAFLTLSTGMFVSSTAYLPSSTSLYLTLLAYGAWFRAEYRLAIFATALSAILSEFNYISFFKQCLVVCSCLSPGSGSHIDVRIRIGILDPYGV